MILLKNYFLLFLILLIASSSILANPFSSKLYSKPIINKEKQIENISYKGYFFMEQRKFAIIEIENKQFSMKEGDKEGSFRLIKIKDNGIIYSYKGKQFIINTNKKTD